MSILESLFIVVKNEHCGLIICVTAVVIVIGYFGPYFDLMDFTSENGRDMEIIWSDLHM